MRKKSVFYVFALLLLMTGAASCSSDENDNDSNTVVLMSETKMLTLTPEQQTMVLHNNDFSFKLFKTIDELQESPKSLAVSPISVSLMLGMLNDGAEGQSAEEILTMLGFPGKGKQEVNEYFQKLTEEIPNVDSKVAIKIANYIAVNKLLGLHLSEQFHADMQQYYQAEVASLDFSSPSAMNSINDWCSQHTDNVIPNIVEKLDKNAFVCLLNAVSFKASWLNKFDVNDTKDMGFVMDNGSEVKLPLMHRNALILYAKNDTYSSIVLPYGSNGRSWRMRVFLPNQGKTINDVLDFLCSQPQESISEAKYNQALVDILFPRFTSTSLTDLQPAIKDMGGASLFDPNHSGLTGICSNVRAYISEFQQKTSLDVDENGTEAETVTIAKGELSAMPTYGSYDFHANRPFVYVIEEAGSGIIFFMGTYRGN